MFMRIVGAESNKITTKHIIYVAIGLYYYKEKTNKVSPLAFDFCEIERSFQRQCPNEK